MLPDQIKPCIVIYFYSHPGYERKIREVQAGMEEEGIPCSIMQSNENDVIVLAYQAASASKLGVGVGIGQDGLSIQYDKLPAKEPLFLLTTPGTPTDWRKFGYNAARLVKGIPFKEQKEQSEEKIDPQCEDSSALYHLVWSIVQKVLQETGQGHGEVKAWSKTH
ncbi:glycerol dehydratase reactivase beta/small subunit family protein [Pelosinus sp. sgz500959]|uniref:glycerol dehydratase reactivase beta/small subunit family protein n=1 Tax=Pelosinus sp. sgz500959 TaxID=3242472 RepID=UPI00366BC2A3